MNEERKNYSRIIKSSSMIGGAQGINMLIGMVRVKFVAILIGPIGVGLVATYQSLIQLFGTLAGMGLQSSAVREIAQAVGTSNQEQIGRTVLSLRRMCWLTGSLGVAIVLLLSKSLSELMFDSTEYSKDISLIGFTILLTNLKGVQMALLQGMRRISDLAKLNIIGALSGTIISICFYWQLGMAGIVPAMVFFSITELLASWWFARKVHVSKVNMPWGASFKAAGGMIKLGLAFMWSSLLVAIIAYLTRTLIAQEIDLVAVGIFSAAYALSGMVVNFVLGAMSADYYPSLTAINHDCRKMRDLVNQQTEVGLLLALPGLLATITLANWFIEVFYSADFYHAADLLRWFAIGCIGRVISWPLGFVILAKGRSRLFAMSETVINLIHIILIITMLKVFGVDGVAYAFFLLYVIYTIMMLGVSKYLIGFSWSNEVWKMLGFLIPLIVFSLGIPYLFSSFVSSGIAIILVGVVSIICFKQLINRLGKEHRLYQLATKLCLLKKN